jgi:hypothetical protein
MLAEVEAAFGRKVDIGIANAGVSLWKDSHDNTDGEWARSGAAQRRGVACMAMTPMTAMKTATATAT